MAQGQIQEQRLTEQQRLTQSITQQQLLVVQLTELPITQLAERINAEMDDNPALEVADDEYRDLPDDAYGQDETDNNPTDSYEQEERQSALDAALESIGRDDEELPVFPNGSYNGPDEHEGTLFGSGMSFYDQLKEQMSMTDLTEQEEDIMEYLVGSLDDDGLLRKPLHAIADELAIYHNVDVSEQQIEQVLLKLQDFDPAGIGARSLQECLLIQVRRREPSKLRDLMIKTLEDYFLLFTKKHWKELKNVLQLNDLQCEMLIKELRKLNPRPGSSISEVVGRSVQQITPDFIIDTQDDGTVTMALNNVDIPELQVSESFASTLQEYQHNKDNMSKQMKEALLYTKKKVDAAQNFIEAVRMRRHTLTITMKAIIQWQHRFFEDGEESSLRPMILKDIAEKTGLDISTVSRVSNSKYAQTRWGTFPLRHFFSDAYTTAEGEELSTRQIKAVLREIIESEDKKKPYTDELLKQLLAEKGFPIARRTVAKYREQLGFPIARLRT